MNRSGRELQVTSSFLSAENVNTKVFFKSDLRVLCVKNSQFKRQRILFRERQLSRMLKKGRDSELRFGWYQAAADQKDGGDKLDIRRAGKTLTPEQGIAEFALLNIS